MLEGPVPTLTPAPCPQVACMQFINIVVHSVEDMNFRVHLQYEFTKLGLEDFLQVCVEGRGPGRQCPGGIPQGWGLAPSIPA